MGKLTATTPRMRQVSMAMVAVSALMAADALYQVGRTIQWRWWLSSATAAEPTTTQPTTTQAATQPGTDKNKAKPPEVHAAIKQRNIFDKAKPKGHGLTLVGVMIDTALFRTRSNQVVGLREGASGHGIKVKTIDGYSVTIEHDGKSETLTYNTGGSGGAPSRPSRSRPPRGQRGPASKPASPGTPQAQRGVSAPSTRAAQPERSRTGATSSRPAP